MDRKRGFTLIELLVVTLVTSIVISAAAGMYSMVMSRVATDAGNASVQMQANSLLGEIQRVVQEASVVDTPTVSGTIAIRCAVPAGGLDKNMDGVPDSAVPSSVSSAGIASYSPAQWVWFYWGDSIGNPSSAGTQLWRAVIGNSATSPSSANADLAWSLTNGSPRFPLLESATFTVNTSAATASATLSFSSLFRADRIGSSEANANLLRRFTASRTYFWGDPR